MMLRDVLSPASAMATAALAAPPSTARAIETLWSATDQPKKRPAQVKEGTSANKKRSAPVTEENESRSPVANKKLRSIAVAKLDKPVNVTPLEHRVFVSWAAFDAYFDAYCTRTFQVFRSNTCVPVSARNARILERLASKGGHANHQSYKIIPDSFETYTRTLVCTHSGEPRRRNEGKRPNRNVRALGCPAKLNIVVRRLDGTVDGPWRVHVTDQVAVHNHVISEEQFKLYPQQRRVTDPDVLRTVRAMHKYGTPRRGIFDYIKDTTRLEAITMRDVTNLLNKMKAEEEKESSTGKRMQQEQDGSDQPRMQHRRS